MSPIGAIHLKAIPMMSLFGALVMPSCFHRYTSPLVGSSLVGHSVVQAPLASTDHLLWVAAGASELLQLAVIAE